MKCSKCNAEIPDSSKFCPQCAEPQNTPTNPPAPPQVVDHGARKGTMKMFLIGLVVAGIAFLAWSNIPGLRYAAPHHKLSPVDVWPVPTNPRMSLLPCQDDLHSGTNWRARVDGLCHAEDAPGYASSESRTEFPPQPPQPQPHFFPVTNGALTVNATAYSYYQFTVPQGATGVNVNGHFTASGGMGNDIIVYVLDEDGFANFKNGHPARTYYNSEKVTQASIGAILPNVPATYYLLFDNRFSLLTPKAVQVNATLNYLQ